MKKLFISLIVVLVLSSCGGGGGSEPADVVKNFTKAMYDNDIARAKECASEASAQLLDMIGRMMAMAPDSVQVDQPDFEFNFSRDSIAGDRAWVWVKGEDGSEDPQAMELVKENGEWKVIFSKN